MFTDAFDKVEWPNVHRALNEEVPRATSGVGMQASDE
jgi:hypothetical protein